MPLMWLSSPAGEVRSGGGDGVDGAFGTKIISRASGMRVPLNDVAPATFMSSGATNDRQTVD
ncbi:hypothetical protein GCM10017653_08800 [Ancylobacter defluvii]|uniref:Uncharacterized protein n=1 Tax=Ancylobacter defluvii TaxID=1282440 RepID=A0A9W6N9V8_9HYPH|nr:hypothetical protein GCM10017653_08800 [Ancylobacter defluvii]